MSMNKIMPRSMAMSKGSSSKKKTKELVVVRVTGVSGGEGWVAPVLFSLVVTPLAGIQLEGSLRSFPVSFRVMH